MKPLGLVIVFVFLLLSVGCSLTGSFKNKKEEPSLTPTETSDPYKNHSTFVKTEITKGAKMHTIVATGKTRLTRQSAIQKFTNRAIYRFCTEQESYAHYSVEMDTWTIVNHVKTLTSQFSCLKKLM